LDFSEFSNLSTNSLSSSHSFSKSPVIGCILFAN
jgi:hypothetical protein